MEAGYWVRGTGYRSSDVKIGECVYDRAHRKTLAPNSAVPPDCCTHQEPVTA